MTDLVAAGAYLAPAASSLWSLSGTRKPLENGKRRRKVRRVVSKGDKHEVKNWEGGLECHAAAVSAITTG
jgi:hypothetical protein